MIPYFTDPARYANLETWHRDVAELRARGPIHRVTADGYDPFWALVGHDLVAEVERHSDLFQNAPMVILTDQEGIRLQAEMGVQPRTLVQMDDPDHTKYRRWGSDWFRPANLTRIQGRLDSLCEKIIDQLRERDGYVDFARDVAMYYPLQVILEILGLPESDFERMLQLTQDYFNSDDPELARDGDVSSNTEAQVLKDLIDYLGTLTADRRANPTDDLASAIANATIDGKPMPELETTSYYMIVATAGHETTSKAISGGLCALIENPDQLEMLKNDPDLIDNAVEEILRYTSPVRHFMRTATRDTELAGQPVAEGDWLLMSYLAANYDPAKFDDPMKFDITRPNASSNLALGLGRHFCLGAPLARMEMRTLFRHLIPRIDTIEYTGKPILTQATFAGGPYTVPIHYTLKD